jgi:hypothetical protein
MVYFSDRKSRPKDAAEARQLQELLSFREAMPREQLWWTYTRPIDFERAVREHLVAVAMAVEEWREAASQHVARPGSGTAPASDIRMVVETDVAIEVFDEVPDRPSPEIIIPTGTPVPFTSRLTVMTTTDDQKTISLTLLERSSGTAGSSDIDDFQKLGTPKFILPPGMPRATSVDLAIGVNPTGQLALDATFPETEFPPASATSGELRIRLRKQSS